MIKYPYTAILGWSSSRIDIFSLCRRKYFYTYYSKFDQEFVKERIDKLKQLTSAPLLVGELTHEVIRIILERLQRSSEPININRLRKHIESQVNKAVGERVFFETYYNGVTISSLKVIDEIFHSITSFIESDRFSWINSIRMSERSNWIIEPEGYGETRIGDLKAYCKVDALIPFEGKAYIFDWKTGRRDDDKHRKQLTGYAMFALKNLGFGADKIVPIVCYLRSEFEECQLELKTAEIENFYLLVKEDTQAMYDLNSDIERNIPLDKSLFTQTTGGICSYCEFKELCGR
jgi:CRISPR/Cas system-associated exonuclease Cas4 (RecB family)